MVSLKFIALTALIGFVQANPSAVEVLQDMYSGCLQDFSVSCVKPKALSWISEVSDKPAIKITDDLVIIKKDNPIDVEEQRGMASDIFDKFEDFLQTHELVAKVPTILRHDGPLGGLVPRSFQPEDVKMPLASTGRSSKIIKKVIVPFLLGLKFKTAVLVPLALALIALKTWKALTLGLLSLVLTGALIIFKITKPKVVNYEVIHYPHHHDHHLDHHHYDHLVDHHLDHHLDHHIDHAATGWDHARQFDAQDLAYSAHTN